MLSLSLCDGMSAHFFFFCHRIISLSSIATNDMFNPDRMMVSIYLDCFFLAPRIFINHMLVISVHYGHIIHVIVYMELFCISIIVFFHHKIKLNFMFNNLHLKWMNNCVK